MNQGPNPPSGSGQPGGKGRRRRRGRRPPAAHGAQQNQQGQQQPGQNFGQQRQGGKKFSRGRKHSQRPGQRPGQRKGHQDTSGVYTAPMDHSYRAQQGEGNGNMHRPNRGRPGQFGKQFVSAELEPLPTVSENSPARIFAFVDDLFFLAKIQETARKLNVKVEFVKSDKDLFERMGQNGGDKPSLIIFDLNSTSSKPLSIIPKLKTKLKKATNIIGFLSHVQGDLKVKAQEAGCDMVVPRSAFSQNLAQILRRHAVTDVHDHDASGQPGSTGAQG